MKATKVFEAHDQRARRVAEMLAPDERWINTVKEIEIFSDGAVYFNDNDSATMYLNAAILDSQIEYLKMETSPDNETVE